MTAVAVEAPLDLRAMWRRFRLPLVIALVLVGAAFVLAAVENAPPERPLDPRDATPGGARALAQLLRDRGVDVIAAPTVAQLPLGADTTVMLPDPGSVSAADLALVASSASDVVVIEPDFRALDALGLREASVGSATHFTSTVKPECTVGPAVVAGKVKLSGLGYIVAPNASGCYPVAGGDALLLGSRGPATTYVFGSAETFSNDRLDEQGDAALGLGLLGRHGTVGWLLPQPATQAAPDTARRGLLELLPARLLWATLMLFVAVLLLALWRGRRLGPVVAEPLPVVVRATETVEGRARLLRAARARATAGAALRDAARARLRDLVGVGVDSPPASLVATVVARTGRPGADVERLLYGADPSDDAALLALADELDVLERLVRRL